MSPDNMQKNDKRHNGRPSGRIRSEIDRTRAQMDETIDALTDSLRLDHLLDEAVGYARRSGINGKDVARKAKDYSGKLLHTIKSHPFSATLIGAGLAAMLFEDQFRSGGSKKDFTEEDTWYHPEDELCSQLDYERDEEAEDVSLIYPPTSLPSGPGSFPPPEDIMEDQEMDYASQQPEHEARSRYETGREKIRQAAEAARRRARSTGHSMQDARTQAGEYARHTRHQAMQKGRDLKHQAEELGHKIKANASSMSQSMKESYHSGKEQAASIYDQHPLVIGAAVLGVGLLAGMLAPRTRREDEWLGDRSDRLKKQARRTGESLIHTGKEVAQDTLSETYEEIKRQGLTPSGLKESAEHVVNDTTEAARDSVHEEGLTPEQMKQKVGQVAEHARDTVKQDIQEHS